MTSSLDEFQVVLKEHPFDVITLSETCLKTTNSFWIINYTYRDERRGGEVGANIKENIKLKERKDYFDIDTTIENTSIEIIDNKDRPLLIGTLYSNPVPIKEKSYFG